MTLVNVLWFATRTNLEDAPTDSTAVFRTLEFRHQVNLIPHCRHEVLATKTECATSTVGILSINYGTYPDQA